MFARDKFLEQLGGARAFWLGNPVLLITTEVVQYALLAVAWIYAIGIAGVELR